MLYDAPFSCLLLLGCAFLSYFRTHTRHFRSSCYPAMLHNMIQLSILASKHIIKFVRILSTSHRLGLPNTSLIIIYCTTNNQWKDDQLDDQDDSSIIASSRHRVMGDGIRAFKNAPILSFLLRRPTSTSAKKAQYSNTRVTTIAQTFPALS